MTVFSSNFFGLNAFLFFRLEDYSSFVNRQQEDVQQMDSNALIIPQSTGTVAAILTIIELFIGTITTICLGPFLYGTFVKF